MTISNEEEQNAKTSQDRSKNKKSVDSNVEVPAAGESDLQKIINLINNNNDPSNIFSLGLDLTVLGLNLNTSEALFASMVSPLLDKSPSKEAIEFFLPSCYYMNPPSLKISHLQKFTVETLLYMFYTIVNDALQGFAAIELYNRGWMYYCSRRKWFTSGFDKQDFSRESPTNESMNGNTQERWIYFEPAIWAKRIHYGKIEQSQFLTVESLREFLKTEHKNAVLNTNDRHFVLPTTEFPTKPTATVDSSETDTLRL